MGNSVSFAPPLPISQLLSTSSNSKDSPIHYKHVLHIWEFHPDASDELTIKQIPINSSELATSTSTSISDESCYVILHTFIRKLRLPDSSDSKVTENKINNSGENSEVASEECFEGKSKQEIGNSDNVNNNNNNNNKNHIQSPNTCYLTNIFEVTRENFTPRGQSSVSFGYHSINQTKLKGKLQYDLYVWNGRNAKSLTRAVTFSNLISLDTTIKTSTESLSNLLCYHFADQSNSISSLFNTTSISSSWRKLTVFNSLFNTLVKDYLLLYGSSKDDVVVRSLNSVNEPSRSSPFISVNNSKTTDKRKSKRNKKNLMEERIIKNIEEAKEVNNNINDNSAQNMKISSKQSFRSISLPSKQLNLVKTGMKLDVNAVNKSKLFIDVSNLPDELKDDTRPPSQERIKRYDKICSKITDDLYLGSDTIARDAKELKKFGITHILNCAGAVCSEYFPESFVYKTLFLTDGKSEDITCLFYDVLDFFEESFAIGGKVFVHCHQGISRSSSMVILYLMWKNKTSFAETHEKVKQLREIANPNAGFMCQLISWWNSLAKPVLSPRLYHVIPHSVNTPSLYMMKLATSLDTRGCFLLHDNDTIYLWKGKHTIPVIEEWALKYATRLQKYEKASSNVKFEEEGKESAAFRFIVGVSLNDVQPKPEFDSYYSWVYSTSAAKGVVPIHSSSNSNNNNGHDKHRKLSSSFLSKKKKKESQ